jgi:branched-subunit amino acid transport protein AzlD
MACVEAILVCDCHKVVMFALYHMGINALLADQCLDSL